MLETSTFAAIGEVRSASEGDYDPDEREQAIDDLSGELDDLEDLWGSKLRAVVEELRAVEP
jgi:hypothetical protein